MAPQTDYAEVSEEARWRLRSLRPLLRTVFYKCVVWCEEKFENFLHQKERLVKNEPSWKCSLSLLHSLEIDWTPREKLQHKKSRRKEFGQKSVLSCRFSLHFTLSVKFECGGGNDSSVGIQLLCKVLRWQVLYDIGPVILLSFTVLIYKMG